MHARKLWTGAGLQASRFYEYTEFPSENLLFRNVATEIMNAIATHAFDLQDVLQLVLAARQFTEHVDLLLVSDGHFHDLLLPDTLRNPGCKTYSHTYMNHKPLKYESEQLDQPWAWLWCSYESIPDWPEPGHCVSKQVRIESVILSFPSLSRLLKVLP